MYHRYGPAVDSGVGDWSTGESSGGALTRQWSEEMNVYEYVMSPLITNFDLDLDSC